MSRRSTAAAAFGGLLLQRGRLQQISIDHVAHALSSKSTSRNPQ